MSIVDGWVLEGCSGAVGPFPPCVDWMDCRHRDGDDVGLHRGYPVGSTARRGSPPALWADAVLVFLPPYRFWWRGRRCRVGRAAGCTAPRRPRRFDALARAYALATGALWWSHRSISPAAPSGPVIVQMWAGSLPHRSHARTSTTFLAMIARLSDHRTSRLAFLQGPQPDADVIAQPPGSRQMCASDHVRGVDGLRGTDVGAIAAAAVRSCSTRRGLGMASSSCMPCTSSCSSTCPVSYMLALRRQLMLVSEPFRATG
jgi:hypothetical protein